MTPHRPGIRVIDGAVIENAEYGVRSDGRVGLFVTFRHTNGAVSVTFYETNDERA